QNDSKSNTNEIKIFPNPTKGQFSIFAEDIVSIEIFNLQGKLIYRGKEKEIDLSSVPAGIYFIKVTTDKQTTTRKLIKN
ncbi:MAG: T9SS type A sorting domain-containing protein, partial [Bacteroidales bacterium]|nr:T9SS type A sorting domain-containing protein [Bacteroidales bacterium]